VLFAGVIARAAMEAASVAALEGELTALGACWRAAPGLSSRAAWARPG
jgi:hypothetical protein